MFELDWNSILIPTLPLAELVLRGSLVYLMLFIVLRLLRRGAGALGITDLLVVVLIADAAQNALGSEYKSVTEGGVLVLTILSWDYLLDWLSFRYPATRPLLRPAPQLLIKDGELQRQGMRREMISKEELLGLLREAGVDRIADVKKCYLEADGKLSVVKQEPK